MAWWLFLAHSASAGPLACGSSIDHDTVLDADVICPPTHTGPALLIATDGVHLDGAGHRIGSLGTALRIEADGVTARNLDLSANADALGHGHGIEAVKADTLVLEDIDVSGRAVGVAVSASESASLARIIARRATTALLLDVRSLTLGELELSGAQTALSLVRVEHLDTEPLSFRDNRRGAVIKDSRGIDMIGWSFVGSGIALALERCDGCSVQGSSFTGAHTGIIVSGEHEDLVVSGNDLSFIYGGPALSIDASRSDTVANNLFDGSRRAIALSHAEAIHMTPDNTFGRGQRALTAEDSVDLALDGIFIGDFPGAALTLSRCLRCTVSGSSLSGAGLAIAVVDSQEIALSGNDLRGSRAGVGLWGSEGVEIDGSNDLSEIEGAILSASDSAVALAGLTVSTGYLLAEDSALLVRDHRSCGASFALRRVTGELQGALGPLSAQDSAIVTIAGGVADSDADNLPDACDPCNDPDSDGLCADRDPCLGQTETDRDGDGWCDDQDCNDALAEVHPGAAEIACNDRDEDCSAATVDRPDLDGDSFASCDDCDDRDPTRFPGAPEICDRVDQDCDSIPDDGLPFDAWFIDADHDGYGSPTPTFACSAPAGHVANHADCDDDRPNVHPGAPEVLHNSIDDDCNRLTPDTEPGTAFID